MAYVYLLTFPNGKIYVGKTDKTPQERLYQHWKYHRKGYPVGAAVRRYGVNAVRIDVLHETPDASALAELERTEILERRAQDRRVGYNVASGGDGGDIFSTLTVDMKDRFRAKARARQAMLTKDPSYLAKLSHPGERNPMYGRQHRDEVKEAQRVRATEQFKKRPIPLEARKRGALAAAKLRRENFAYSKDQLLSIRAEMLGGLSITKAMKKYDLKQTTAEFLRSGKHWVCRTP